MMRGAAAGLLLAALCLAACLHVSHGGRFDKYITCEVCKAAGYGWSEKRSKCGGYPRLDCPPATPPPAAEVEEETEQAQEKEEKAEERALFYDETAAIPVIDDDKEQTHELELKTVLSKLQSGELAEVGMGRQLSVQSAGSNTCDEWAGVCVGSRLQLQVSVVDMKTGGGAELKGEPETISYTFEDQSMPMGKMTIATMRSGNLPMSFFVSVGLALHSWGEHLRGMCVGETRNIVVPKSKLYGIWKDKFGIGARLIMTLQDLDDSPLTRDYKGVVERSAVLAAFYEGQNKPKPMVELKAIVQRISNFGTFCREIAAKYDYHPVDEWRALDQDTKTAWLGKALKPERTKKGPRRRGPRKHGGF